MMQTPPIIFTYMAMTILLYTILDYSANAGMCPVELTYLLSCMILWLCFYLVVEDGDCCQWKVYETGGCVQRAHRITKTLVHSKNCIMFLICCQLKRELWHFLLRSLQVDGGTYMIDSSYTYLRVKEKYVMLFYRASVQCNPYPHNFHRVLFVCPALPSAP